MLSLDHIHSEQNLLQLGNFENNMLLYKYIYSKFQTTKPEITCYYRNYRSNSRFHDSNAQIIASAM